MAKTVGHQTGSITVSDQGLGTLIYTAPSTGVTKIIMCELAAKAPSSFSSYKKLNMFTKSNTVNGSANMVATILNAVNQSAYWRRAAYGTVLSSVVPSDGGTHPGGGLTGYSTGANGYDIQLRYGAYQTSPSFCMDEFYLAPTSKIYLWQDSGFSDIVAYYSFITINET